MTLCILELRGKQGACRYQVLLPDFHVEAARICLVERDKRMPLGIVSKYLCI